MIIPSIDIQGGQAVQLVGGAELAIEAGDPLAWADRFGLVGEVAVVDLDAALGRGDNTAVIESLLSRADVRVGGGIRSVDTALRWLQAGAHSVVLGTAARPEILRQLPPERVIAALDAVDGEVVVEGWQTRTGVSILERMRELEGLVGGFLVTFVEREGRMGGTALDRVAELVEAAGRAQLTIAGGVSTVAEVAELDRMGASAQVGMALYRGDMDLGEAFAAPLKSDRPDGLIPTVVTDERGVSLGLCYSSRESIAEAIRTRRGVYQSRKRGLWRKGATSGDVQTLRRVRVDCDRDALSFEVSQTGGFCHLGTRTCFGPERGLGALHRTLEARKQSAPEGSYTQRLFRDPELLARKLIEEAGELAEAHTPADVAWEAADVMYFASVAMARAGVSLADVEAVLDKRARKVQRRAGDAKSTEPPSFSALSRALPDEVRVERVDPVDPSAAEAVRPILQDVEREGMPAVLRYAKKFGDITDDGAVVYTAAELKQALGRLPEDKRRVLERTAARIEDFARAQREVLGNATLPIEGGQASARLQPVERAGCYAPGGRFPLPSSVLMTAVTARAAGVKEVWVASPRPTIETLAAAAVAGADGLLAIGGAQAVGALAFGAGEIPACDIIVGPGNRFVTAAKQAVSGRVAIDLPAGPSELLVVASSDADASVVAADLLAQAEHDPDARVCVISDDDAFLERVDEELRTQLAVLPTRAIAEEALCRAGRAVKVEDWEQALSVANALAPEHLEVQGAAAEALADRLDQYGALFVGSSAAEVLGDYGAGPNHVLPTGGSARSFGGLSVLSFLRVQTRLELRAAAASLVEDCVALARMEGLEAHARAAEARVTSLR